MSLITFNSSVRVSQFCGASFFYQGGRNCILCVQWNILGKNAFTKNFNITSSTWYIEREIVVLLMKNFGQVAQNSFFVVYIEVSEGKFNFSKNYSAYRLQTLSQKFFPLGKNNSPGLSKLSSTSPGEHFGERDFENFFLIFGHWVKVFLFLL